jgi:hypothetical protein
MNQFQHILAITKIKWASLIETIKLPSCDKAL